MTFLDSVHGWLCSSDRGTDDDRALLYECRDCGTSFDAEPGECPICGSSSIACYDASTFR